MRVWDVERSWQRIKNLLGAIAIGFVLVLLFMIWFARPAVGAELARDPQQAIVIDPDENPWQIPRETGFDHSPQTIHLEMGIQLERALDVAYDELRKVDQSVQDAPRPSITILIYRHDGHTVEINGTYYRISKRLHEPPISCLNPPWPRHPECPDE